MKIYKRVCKFQAYEVAGRNCKFLSNILKLLPTFRRYFNPSCSYAYNLPVVSLKRVYHTYTH